MWKKSANSDILKPPEIDTSSSKAYVYVRRNFTLVDGDTNEETDENGTTPSSHWEYEENKIPKADWQTYSAILENSREMEQVKADMLYLSMMTGVDL